MPAISIIIPMYNVEKYLPRCLDSVLNQTFTDWQAICVDDGSPDNSGKIAEQYAARDSRFVVIHKKNGGLSDARNVGMPHATGKYIMYLDSDDFIHPQTMEIVYDMAQRDNSDIVSFTYDRIYRPRLMVRHVLGMNTDNVVPWGMNKLYKTDKIQSKVTDDIFEYATENAHNLGNKNRRWLIKHCQVWKNMYRRSLIADTPFIKGILFEDFPWWSTVMLKNPRVTIINLPLYYYIPKFGGIVLSAKQLRIMESLCTGISHAYGIYKKSATDYQMTRWQENFMWYFVNWAFRKVRFFTEENEIKLAKNLLRGLCDNGVLDNVPSEFFELRNKIYEYIKD